MPQSSSNSVLLETEPLVTTSNIPQPEVGPAERRQHLNSLAHQDDVLWEETLPGASTWSHILKRGTALRIETLEDNCNVGAIFLNADNPTERLNLPDSLKAQHIARLTAGSALFSDMGRVLCSITDDTLGWHDPLGGCSDDTMVEQKYGKLSYQEGRNHWHVSALDGFLIELAKYGLSSRDLTMNVNFFSKVEVLSDGSMHFVPNFAKAGAAVELRAEMNTLVLLNTCQHPMDPDPNYAQRAVKLTLKKVAAPGPDDLCRTACDENRRGFTLTERYFL
ncbi:urea amidolyase associated protein UAAP1 [Granulicella paludicola]|uniref:urea amidolyase associated protein UAAP1 n=1 Tax=Granulicella paludicola TaxID=474951 RepID=UPI0021E0E99D|nr:urea amidolyase associated protein UAAP1 [Granulicella paludicola]